jgi:glyoxylase-like metal-dependent hydrolase (beta-lactamase superfamily II)
MAIGDVWTVTENDCEDLYVVDTGMYDTEAYGAAYLLDAERPAIVETGIGTDYEYVLDMLDFAGVGPEDVEVIAPTHVHLDHAGGAGFLAAECPDADVYVHEMGARHLVDPTQLVEGTRRAVGDQWEFYVEPEPVPEERIVELADGDDIDLGDHLLDVHHAPGHAPHQVVFHDRENDAVFAADAAGIWVPEARIVRQTTPPPNFDLEGALADVEMLRELDPGTLLYTHFGPQFDPHSVLQEYEDVLSAWVAEVEAARDELGDDDAVIEHFVDTTEMVPYWGERKARAEEALNTTGVLVYLDRE